MARASQADRCQRRRPMSSTRAMRPAAVRWPRAPPSWSGSATAASSTMGTARRPAVGHNSGRPGVLAACWPYERLSGEIATVSVSSSTSSGSGARCRAREAAGEPGCARFHSTRSLSAVGSRVLTVAGAAPPRPPAPPRGRPEAPAPLRCGFDGPRCWTAVRTSQLPTRVGLTATTHAGAAADVSCAPTSAPTTPPGPGRAVELRAGPGGRSAGRRPWPRVRHPGFKSLGVLR